MSLLWVVVGVGKGGATLRRAVEDLSSNILVKDLFIILVSGRLFRI